MSQLTLYLFGPPRLEVDGEGVHIPRRKALALLAYLAVTGQPHSRDSLAALLWPESNQSSARGGLRRMLSSLKRSLGEGWLVTDRKTAALNMQHDISTGQSFWLDVTIFRDMIKVCEAHNHPPTVTCPNCLPALEEAVELYRDDFMAGFSLKDCPAYDEWQFFQAEELRTQLTNALVRLSSHHAASLDYETAIRYARRWLVLDPLHEPAHRQLMALYEQAGQRSAALRQYQICRETLAEELGVKPSEETRDLYQKIQANTVAASRELRLSHNLPVQSTPFIGRVNELVEIQARLKDEGCHLLTLLGPGGSGKTRLAIEAAGQLLDDFKHGAFFVNLAPLQEVDKIPSTIANALRFSFSGEASLEEHLLDYLRQKEMLLILDNFEHLLDGAGFIIQTMRIAPGIKILATSRIRLMVTGEHIYDVWGMAYPQSPVSLEDAPQHYSAVKLFESAACRAQGDFELDEDNLPDVTKICSLLEGMPLGIILAANWVTMVTPEEIATEIARNLEFLDVELRDLPRRQRSLQSVFNHSWRLLSEGERDVLAALSVFRGGFVQETAQGVAGVSLRALKSLTDQSILHRTLDGRYEMHEVVRQYAAEKLGQDPVIEADIRAKHSDFYCQALAVWERQLQGPQQIAANQEMKTEIGNIRVAWRCAVENLALKSLIDGINGLCIFFLKLEQRLEAEAICLSLVERLEAISDSEGFELDSAEKFPTTQIDLLKLQARALAWGVHFNSNLGNNEFAHSLIQRCLSLLERDALVEQDTRFERAVVFSFFPWVIENKPRAESIQLAEEGLGLFKSLDESWWVGKALSGLGHLANSINDLDKLKLYREENLVVTRKLGNLDGIAESLINLSYCVAGQKAEEMLYEALAIYTELDNRHDLIFTYGVLGAQWSWQGRFREARSLYHETLAAYSDLDFTQSFSSSFYSHLGTPELHLGRYQAAQELAVHTIDLLKDVNIYFAPLYAAFAVEILGGVALAEGSYDEAERCFQECLRVFQSHELPGGISQALSGLGFAARGLNQISQAHGYFYQALSVAINNQSYVALIHALSGIALLFADQGDVERAVELYALASTYGIVANSKWFADIAGDEIAAMSEELPAEVVEAAKARGRSLDLWETAAELLDELEKMGWANADPQPPS